MTTVTGIPMHEFGLGFHHLGLASRRPELTLKLLQGMGYSVTGQVYDPLQNVYLRLCMHPSMPTLELVAPADGAGPLDKILSTAGESLYHLCYETADPDGSVEDLKAAGHRVICMSPPKPAVLFNGRRVSFYLVKGLGLIELLETTDATVQ